jgi:hypothetical protein
MAMSCQAITKKGTRCTVPTQRGKSFCLCHDPETRELRRRASRQGGINGSTVARLRKRIPEAMTEAELAGLMSKLLQDVMSGKVDVKVAQASAVVARVLIEAKRFADQPRVSDLEQQVAELTALVEQRTTRPTQVAA